MKQEMRFYYYAGAKLDTQEIVIGRVLYPVGGDSSGDVLEKLMVDVVHRFDQVMILPTDEATWRAESKPHIRMMLDGFGESMQVNVVDEQHQDMGATTYKLMIPYPPKDESERDSGDEAADAE